MLTVGSVVLPKNLMEPDRRLGEHVRPLPGVPRQVGLGFARDQAPVDGGHVVLVCHGQRRVKGASVAASHVFGAENGPAQRLKLADTALEDLGPIVAVEGDHVRLGELNPGRLTFAARVRPVACPDAAGERLGGVYAARPGEGERQQLIDAAYLGGNISDPVAALVVGLVPDVPGEHAGIVGKSADDATHVGGEFQLDLWIEEALLAWALHPAGVMDAGDGRVLRTEVRSGLPAGVEQDEDGADVMPTGDGEKGVEALLEAGRILAPELVLEEDAGGVHADGLGEAKLFVVQGGVEGGGLEHLELVDGVRRDVVGADEPGLPGVPLVGAFGGPAIGSSLFRGVRGKRNEQGKQDRANKVRSLHNSDSLEADFSLAHGISRLGRQKWPRAVATSSQRLSPAMRMATA